MNDDPREDGSSGRLIQAATKSVAPVTVDCAGWDAGIPAEQWSSGKLVSVTRSLSAAGKEFTAAGSLELEIALRIEPEVNPPQAFALAAQLVAEIIACDPGLRLTYVPDRFRAEEGRVVIVLIPSRPGPDAESRLGKIAEVIRKATGEAGGIALNEVRILRAA